MDYLLKVIEKILFNLVLSFLLFLASFSFLTGKFPPQKEDMKKAFSIGKELFVSTKEYNQSAKEFATHQSPSLPEIVMIQRLSLRRTEAALAFSELLARLGKRPPSPELVAQVQEVNEHLDKAEVTLNKINASIQQLSEGK
jgi:hypothetical protein